MEEAFGRKLRNLRKQKYRSQDEFAKALKGRRDLAADINISRHVVSAWENLSPTTVYAIEEILGASHGEFLIRRRNTLCEMLAQDCADFAHKTDRLTLFCEIAFGLGNTHLNMDVIRALAEFTGNDCFPRKVVVFAKGNPLRFLVLLFLALNIVPDSNEASSFLEELRIVASTGRARGSKIPRPTRQQLDDFNSKVAAFQSQGEKGFDSLLTSPASYFSLLPDGDTTDVRSYALVEESEPYRLKDPHSIFIHFNALQKDDAKFFKNAKTTLTLKRFEKTAKESGFQLRS